MLSLVKTALKNGKSVLTTVTGNSMLPFLKSGDKITIVPKNINAIKLYDLVAVDIGDNIAIHQCLFRSKDYIVCHGTNNKFIDPPALKNQILGTVEINHFWQIINVYYDSEVKKIRQLLSNKIPLLILKGATWQKETFGYYFNKPVSDIDILIKPQDYSDIAKVLISLGYQSKYDKPISVLNNEIINSKINEISFYKLENQIPITIDIHFKAVRSALNRFFTAPIAPADTQAISDELWQNSYKNKDNLCFLKNEYLLFYLCLHCFFNHGVRDINSLSKIATIINTSKIDWEKFWNLAQKYNMKNFLYYPLGWSKRFFKIKMINLDKYRPSNIQRIFAKILINHHTVFRPFINLGSDIVANKINIHLISFLRLVLFS